MKKVEKQLPAGVVTLEEFTSYRARTDAAIAELSKTVTKLSVAIAVQNPQAGVGEKNWDEMNSTEKAAAIVAAGRKARGENNSKPVRLRYDEESWPPPGVVKLKEACRATGRSPSSLTKLLDAGQIVGWRRPLIWIKLSSVPEKRSYGQSVKKM